MQIRAKINSTWNCYKDQSKREIYYAFYIEEGIYLPMIDTNSSYLNYDMRAN